MVFIISRKYERNIIQTSSVSQSNSLLYVNIQSYIKRPARFARWSNSLLGPRIKLTIKKKKKKKKKKNTPHPPKTLWREKVKYMRTHKSFFFILMFHKHFFSLSLTVLKNVSVNCLQFVGELSPNYMSVNCLGTRQFNRCLLNMKFKMHFNIHDSHIHGLLLYFGISCGSVQIFQLNKNNYCMEFQVRFSSLLQVLFNALRITKTCLYNFSPLQPIFYIVKQRFTGVYIIFSYFCSQSRL